MAYLDDNGLQTLWAQVDSIFARLTEAGASISLSGTNLVLTSAAGTQLASVDLGATFATDAEVQQAISSGTSGMLTRAAADGLYARSMTYVSSTKQLTLRDGNGNALSTVTIN